MELWPRTCAQVFGFGRKCWTSRFDEAQNTQREETTPLDASDDCNNVFKRSEIAWRYDFVPQNVDFDHFSYRKWSKFGFRKNIRICALINAPTQGHNRQELVLEGRFWKKMDKSGYMDPHSPANYFLPYLNGFLMPLGCNWVVNDPIKVLTWE